jgi:hypothetical protein
MLHLSPLKAPLELSKLHQLLIVVPGVEILGLRFHQDYLVQVQVPLFPIEPDLHLPQHLVKAEGVPGLGGMHLHLVKVLLSSS